MPSSATPPPAALLCRHFALAAACEIVLVQFLEAGADRVDPADFARLHEVVELLVERVMAKHEAFDHGRARPTCLAENAECQRSARRQGLLAKDEAHTGVDQLRDMVVVMRWPCGKHDAVQFLRAHHLHHVAIGPGAEAVGETPGSRLRTIGAGSEHDRPAGLHRLAVNHGNDAAADHPEAHGLT